MAGQIEEDAAQSVVSDTTEESQSPPFSGGWYFSRDLIERYSPSRRDGISLSKENQLRKSYCTFMQNLGIKLKLPQNTIATAIVFCHRFYLRQSHATNDRFTIATACIFLAGKVEETPKVLQHVIFASYEMRNKKDPTAIEKLKLLKEAYEKEKELILLAESLILTTLDFDLNIAHPYKFLVTAIKKLKVGQTSLAQVGWNFVNDGLRTTLCLQYNPRHIAAGAIFLAAKFLKLKLPNDKDVVWWQEFEISARQLEDVSNQMLELYEQHPNHKSSAPSSSDISMLSGATPSSKANNLTTNSSGDICNDDAEKTPCTGVKRPNIETNVSSEVTSQNDNASEQQYYENQLKCGHGQECKRFCSDNSKNQTVLSSSVF